MSYAFPPDISQRILAQLKSGSFKTEDDVLREAISTLEQRQNGLAACRNLVREADEDITAGRVGPFEFDEEERKPTEQERERERCK